MDHEEKRELARLGDISTEATSFRMRAARMALGLSSKDMAEELGMPATSYGAYENGKAHPKLAAIRYLYRQYDINFDFILYGDFRRLPAEHPGADLRRHARDAKPKGSARSVRLTGATRRIRTRRRIASSASFIMRRLPLPEIRRESKINLR